MRVPWYREVELFYRHRGGLLPTQTTARSEGRLRQAANASTKQLATIPTGARLTVCNTEGSYAQVIYSGIIDYVDNTCLMLPLGENARATTAPVPVSPSAAPPVIQCSSSNTSVFLPLRMRA